MFQSQLDRKTKIIKKGNKTLLSIEFQSKYVPKELTPKNN